MKIDISKTKGLQSSLRNLARYRIVALVYFQKTEFSILVIVVGREVKSSRYHFRYTLITISLGPFLVIDPLL